MDSYLLKSEETGIEALLVSIPTTSELFSKITLHESIDPELEATLVKDLKNFRFEQALYCATNIYGRKEGSPLSKQFLNKKDLDSAYIKSESSEEFGKQSIYRLKENISLDSIYRLKENSSLDSPDSLLEKIILLDGHHRFAAINKHYIKVWNEVPIIFVNFSDINIDDHYLKIEETQIKKGWIEPEKDLTKKHFDNLLNQAYGTWFNDDVNWGHIDNGNSGDYDYVFSIGGDVSYYFKATNKDKRDSESRLLLRDKLIDTLVPGFKPSKPPQGDKSNGSDIFFAAKAPTKEELDLEVGLGVVFPPKSTWVTPKFNPDLYREYLN